MSRPREAAPDSGGRLAADTGRLMEAVGTDEAGPRYRVRVIQAGLSGNGNFYPDTVLREAVALFDGARVFVKSDADHLRSAGKDVRNLLGKLSDPAFKAGPGADSGWIEAVLTPIDPADAVAIKLREAVQRKMTDLFGLSIDADGRARKGSIAGRPARICEALTKVYSVDLIVEPGAGGRVEGFAEAQGEDAVWRERLIEAIRAKRPELLKDKDVAALGDDEVIALHEAVGAPPPAKDEPAAKPVDPEETARLIEAKVTERLGRLALMRDRVAASKLPGAAKARIIKEFEALSTTFTEAAVDTRIKAEIEYLAPLARGGRVTGLGDTALVEGVEDRRTKIATMLDAFFDPAHADHRHAQSFKECYVEITGDSRVTGRLRECDGTRLREALGSESWDAVLGDALYRRLIADYRSLTDLDIWKLLTGDPTPAPDFRLQTRTRFGGYGDLPAVAEAGAYLPLTSPGDDDPVTFAVSKRGGLETITAEMIKNDDVGAIRTIPTKMSRAAKRTLVKFVLDFVRTNPVIFDGKALFHADHANLGTAALDAAAYAAARLAMVKQTEYGQTGERIGLGPKYLWLPAELEETAYNLFQRSTNNDKTFVQTLVPTIVPVWYWTDANDWALSVDPLDIPTIELSFLDGNQEPELFVQDSPTSGSMFANDQITYKIRHIYGGNVLDYRGLRKNVVA